MLLQLFHPNWLGRVITQYHQDKFTVCPPLVGDDPPSGCDKNFVEDVDGDIPCQDDQDCPQSEDWWLDGQCSEGKEIIFGKCEKFRRKRR